MKIFKYKKSLLILALFIGVFGYGFAKYRSAPVKYKIMSQMMMVRLGLKDATNQSEAWLDNAIISDVKKISNDHDEIPFTKLPNTLGELSEHREFNTNWFRGATIFDANGDGRQDLFFPNMSKPIAKATVDNVMGEERFPARPNGLFMNLGNDDDGNPIFKSVQDMQLNANDTLVHEELLFEGKLFPRKSIAENSNTEGRIGWGAVSADFNADGRLDLYILNGHFGIPFQTKELGWRIYPVGTNLGRDVKSKPIIARAPSFLSAGLSLEDGLNVKLKTANGLEYEGKNTLLLNMGDKDNDGIPEWKDVTDESGVGGKWASNSAEIADFDRDGDLDIYVTSFLDPDFTGFPIETFPGNRNQLYKNLLVEEGELKFVDIADDDLAGVHTEGGLESYSFDPRPDVVERPNNGTLYHEGELVGEIADHSWSALFHDWNHDGWLDIVVANDQGNRFRAYKSLEGKGFEYVKKFNDSKYEGCWMGMSVGDLDMDGKEEVLATNCGSQIMSTRNTRLLIKDETERSVTAASNLSYALGNNNLSNAILTFDESNGLELTSTVMKVDYSTILPPDQLNPDNVNPEYSKQIESRKFKTTLAGLEFAFNAPFFDVENDGDLDIYFAGGLGRGGDNFGDMAGSPGRFLENISTVGNLHFVDKTLEYQLFDISDMDYSVNPPRRPSPGSGWNKRDYVYITDVGAYEGFGVAATNSKAMDIYRLHEQAACLLAADLNNDGFQDLMVTHIGGYTSNSPSARNLKVDVMGKSLAVPPVTKLSKAPTGFDPGQTYIYINENRIDSTDKNWIKLRLIDKTSKNLFGVGSRVTVNGKYHHRVRATQGTATGSVYQDLHVGLADGMLESLEIQWPTGEFETTKTVIENPVVNQTVCVDRNLGVVTCKQ